MGVKKSKIKPLEPPDSHHLSAAVGWLGLGNPKEAGSELEKIALEIRCHPHVLLVRYEIFAKSGQWDAAAEIARALIELEPQQPGGWISLAYAMRRKTGGGIPMARSILEQARKHFPKEEIIAYNLACYDCQLGNLEAARSWLKQAQMMGDGSKIVLMALKDPDLKPLWPEIQIER